MDDSSSDIQEKWQINADYSFQALYTVELLLKCFGMGFVFNSGAYLRDPWNVLDFVIVVSGYLSYLKISDAVDLKVLRTFRILRPLRTITTIEGLRILMDALFSSVPLLLDTLIILGFFFMIFAIAGLQMWNGMLTKRCLNIATGYVDNDAICGSHTCPEGQVCVDFLGNPNFGNTNFDNIFSAFLTVFQTVTLEGWTDNMRYIAFACGDYTVIYFALLAVLGAYFLLNFTLAVIKSRVSKTYDDNRVLIMQKRREKLELFKEQMKEKMKRISINWSLAGVKLKKIAKKFVNLHIEGSTDREVVGNKQENNRMHYAKQLDFPNDFDEDAHTYQKINLEETKIAKIFIKKPLWGTGSHLAGEVSPKEEANSIKSKKQEIPDAPPKIKSNFIKALSSMEAHQQKQKARLSGIEEFTNTLLGPSAEIYPKAYLSSFFIQDKKHQKDQNESFKSIEEELDDIVSPKMTKIGVRCSF